MKIQHHNFNHQKDFLNIRDFLINTYSQFDLTVNWTFERWNYARYFIMPMIGAYGKDPVTIEDSLQAIQFWDDHTHVWKTAAGEIAAVLTLEYPWAGEVFLLRGVGHDYIMGEMMDKAEETLVHPEKKTLNIYIFNHDTELQSIAIRRGYKKLEDRCDEVTEYTIEGQIPEPDLQSGFLIHSMADDNDLERRRKAFGLGFNHEDPKEWPSLYSYQELQKAPDYRPELDLYVVAPDGEFASFCIMWWDEVNRLATLEPVGTVPNYRRMGLARAVIYEGIRRVADLGASKVLVGAGAALYLSLGFKKIACGNLWQKEYR